MMGKIVVFFSITYAGMLRWHYCQGLFSPGSKAIDTIYSTDEIRTIKVNYDQKKAWKQNAHNCNKYEQKHHLKNQFFRFYSISAYTNF